MTRQNTTTTELGDAIPLESRNPHFNHSSISPTNDFNDDAEQNSLSRSDIHHMETARKRACVIVGSAVIQLPIWGFAMNYGVFQEYYSSNWTLAGSREVTGIIGTTSNGVMYLSMPFLFALFTRRWAAWRRTAAICGTVIACLSFFLSSFSTHVAHLVISQGIMAALGCALIYSPMTLSLGEWYNTGNRALAYGIVLSCKNIVGSGCPFLLRALLDRYGFRTTLKIWTGIVGGSAILGIFLMLTPPSVYATGVYRSRQIPTSFLRHKTIYIYSVATALQSAGYGIPQTYLASYAREVTHSSQTTATLLLTVFCVPGIVASAFFGYLSDKKRFSLSASTVTAISAVSTAVSAFLFWGMTSPGSEALLILFSVTFGFFAGGYSSTWGGVINEMESEAAQRNEAIDSGVVYGLLNGARGIGYVSGGLAGVPLLKVRASNPFGIFAYGSSYGPLILFTGFSTLFGGWAVLWRLSKVSNTRAQQ